MTLFVYGAGATRGCSFVNPGKHPCLPPLDQDFFTQIQRIGNSKHQTLVTEVMRDIVGLFGPNFEVTMETVFTTLEHTIRMVQLTGETRDFRLDELEAIRDRLIQAIAAVFEESLCTGKRSGTKRQPSPCAHHAAFVSEILQPADAIISFNYDCTFDFALKNHGNGTWNSHYGYGFKLGPQGRAISGDEFWQPRAPATKRTTVRLLKLHGSLHFQIDDLADTESPVRLKERPYTKQSGDKLKFTIIPPEWHKRFDEGIFAHLWGQASDAIYDAHHVVFIGYSLPLTDLHSTALFQTSVKKGALRSLVVVNPDKAARRRTRTVLQRGLNQDTRILSFDYFNEFVAANRKLWHT